MMGFGPRKFSRSVSLAGQLVGHDMLDPQEGSRISVIVLNTDKQRGFGKHNPELDIKVQIIRKSQLSVLIILRRVMIFDVELDLLNCPNRKSGDLLV
jgi:hypothetical protein